MPEEDDLPQPPTDDDATELMTPPTGGVPFMSPSAPRAQVIGDYEVMDKLGAGGMGAVYRARQRSLDRLVALKILPAHLIEDEESVARFRREARVAANLSHPNLVRVYSAGEADGCHYIAMELIRGEDLGRRLKRAGKLSPPEALRVVLEVARGLEYAWQSAQLIHRDIKPANIFLADDGLVKVGDLGLAKALGGETTGLTQTGTMMGTPHYISPEQARNEAAIDFRADIYSLGCTLFHMLTGQTPYGGKDPITIIRQHLDAPLPAILKVWPQCPVPLARLVGKMLRKHRNERQGSYAELIGQIESVWAQLEPLRFAAPVLPPDEPDPDSTRIAMAPTPTPRPATAATRVLPVPRKSKLPLYGGIAAGVLVLGLAAVFMSRPKEEPLTIGQRQVLARQAEERAAAERARLTSTASAAAAEPWYDVLAVPGALQLMSGAVVSDGKLALPERAGGAIIIATNGKEKQRDGAVRMRVPHGENQPTLIARQAEQNRRYAARVKDGRTVVIERTETDNRNAELATYPLATPLTNGEIYELELRAAGPRLSVRLNRVLLGTVEDTAVAQGWFGVRNFGVPAKTLEALAFLPLDSLPEAEALKLVTASAALPSPVAIPGLPVLPPITIPPGEPGFVREVKVPGGFVRDYQLLPDGRRLLAGGTPMTLLDLETGATLWTEPPDVSGGINTLAVSADGTRFATYTLLDAAGKTILGGPTVTAVHVALRDMATGKGLQAWRLPAQQMNNSTNQIALSPSGRRIVVRVGADNRLQLGRFIGLEQGQEKPVTEWKTPDHEGHVTLALDEDRFLSTGGGPAVLLRFSQPKNAEAIEDDSLRTKSASTPDGTHIAVTRAGDLISLWDTGTRQPLRDLDQGFGNPSALAFAGPHRIVALSNESLPGPERRLHVWDAASGRLLTELSPQPGTFLTGLRGSPDGRFVVARRRLADNTDDGTFQIWRLPAPPAAAPGSSAKSAAAIPAAALTYGGHRYQIVEGKHTWEQSRAEAEKTGGHLAVVTTAEEDRFLREELNRRHPGGDRIRYWIGAAAPKGDGVFSWITSDPLAFTAWGGAEPNDHRVTPGKAHRVYYSRDRNYGLPEFAWADASDNDANRTGYIVEWDTPGSAAAPQWRKIALTAEQLAVTGAKLGPEGEWIINGKLVLPGLTARDLVLRAEVQYRPDASVATMVRWNGDTGRQLSVTVNGAALQVRREDRQFTTHGGTIKDPGGAASTAWVPVRLGVVGEQSYGTVWGVSFGSAKSSHMTEAGEVGFSGIGKVRDVAVLLLDGLPEAEALQLATTAPAEAADFTAEWIPLRTPEEWAALKTDKMEFRDGLLHLRNVGLFTKPHEATADGAVRAKVRILAETTYFSVFGRTNANGDQYKLVLGKAGTVSLVRGDAAYKTYNLAKADASRKISEGDVVTLELRIHGNQLTGLVDGRVLIQHEDDTVRGVGGWGIHAHVGAYESAEVQFGTPPPPSESTPAAKDAPFVNSLGMNFRPVPITGGPTDGQRVLFSVWETRNADYGVFSNDANHAWQKADFEQGPTHPAAMVTIRDAEAFCAWLTERERKAGRLGANEAYRLPSDHEWSCAMGIGAQEDPARSAFDKNGKVPSYPWGSAWPPPAGAGNYNGEEAPWSGAGGKLTGYRDPFPRTSPVGSFAANALGLYDLSGNVWELCPKPDSNGQQVVIRGGSCQDVHHDSLASSKRGIHTADSATSNIGFRVVLAPVGP